MADDMDLITCDSGDLYDQLLLALMNAVGEPLYPGDERRIFVEGLLAVHVPLYNAIEDAAKQTSLTYARGSVLDALGARLNVSRLAGTAAVTILRFTLSEIRDVSTIIPAGAKVKTDTDVTFATDIEAVIPAGDLTADVLATASAAGESGNGFAPGDVGIPVDKIPYIASVQNTVATVGGSDGEGYDDEGDDRYRERIRLAASALSVAGPERAYEYWAKSADAGIADVAVISEDEEYSIEVPVEGGKVYLGGELLEPDKGLTVNGQDTGFTWTYKDWLLVIELQEELAREETVTVHLHHRLDGRVRIVPLMEDGESPDEDVMGRIYDACNATDVRPMTDVVRVDKPTRISYDIEVEYWAPLDTEAAVVEAIEGADGAIARYVSEQDSRLGRDINPDVLKAYIMEAGAIRVDVTQPTHTTVEAGEAAKHSGETSATHHVETQARWD